MALLPFKLISRTYLQKLLKSQEQLSEEVAQAVEFIQNVENGNLVAEQDLRKFRRSTLLSSLFEMQQKQRKLSENEQRRNWVSEGLALFANLLRDHQDFKTLSDHIISRVVKYLGAKQGGLFLLSEEEAEETHLELIACYAYDRKKYLRKKVYVGEGLLGQSFLEKESVLVNEIPRDYAHIQSGLGEASPSCIAIVPLKINDEIYGVIELASFQSIEPHQIEFLEKLGENIASTLANLKINARTQSLLLASQKQAEVLRDQEQEMRENNKALEEALNQSQSQASLLKQKENAILESQTILQKVVDSMPHLAIFWKNNHLEYLGCNQLFADINGLNATKDILGKTDYDLPWDQEDVERFHAEDRSVIDSQEAKIDIEDVQANEQGEEIWLRTTKVPLFDQDGKVYAVLGMCEDITEQKNKKEEIESLHEENKDLQKKQRSLKKELKQSLQENKDLKEELQKLRALLNKNGASKEEMKGD